MTQRILFSIFLLAGVFSFTSCNQCIGPFGKEKVVCDNGGTCNDGECDCLKGFSGETCSEVDLCELNDVVCVYGNCEEGVCICETGYEGDECQIETRAMIIGKYAITEGCENLDTLGVYDIEIERNLNSADRINITNLFNYTQWGLPGFFSKWEARVNPGTNGFTIYNQSPDDNAKTVSGSGNVDFSDTNQISITIDYQVLDGNKSYSCSITGVKVE